MMHLRHPCARRPVGKFLTAITLLAGAACSGVDTGGSETDLLGADQEHATAWDVATWTTRPMPLNICFIRGETNSTKTGYLTTAEFNQLASWGFTALTQAWQLVPGISFLQSCAGTPLNVTLLKSGGGSGGICGPGPNGACTVNTVITDQLNYQAVLVHEVGHGLGMAHEHQQVGAPPLCPAEQSYLDACTTCLQVDAAGQPCAAASYNLCLGAAVTVPTFLTQANRDKANEVIFNRSTDTASKKLTTYDPYSIMNYCAAYNGRPLSFVPTPLDLLGMEMLYPQSSTYRLKCGSGCLLSGGGVIIRSDGFVTTDWTARGAADVMMSNTSTPTATKLGASVLPSSGTFNFTFWDPRGNTHAGSGTVVKSTPYHTAMLTGLAVL